MNLNQLSQTYKLKKKQNVLIGCIYRHPSMNQEELKKYYLNNLLEKSAMEKKTIFLPSDFNINLLEYEKRNPTKWNFRFFVIKYFLQLHMLSYCRKSHSINL